MTLDERLEALVTSTELMSGMLKDVLANTDKLTTQIEKLTGVMEALTGTMSQIAQLVLVHEDRIKRLEGEQ